MFIEFLVKHQLSIMLMLAGVCGNLALFMLFIKTMSKKRKAALTHMDVSAGLLLIFDRYAYLFRGDVSDTGYVMVRVSNFSVFFLTLFCLYMFNSYLADVAIHDAKLKKVPLRLKFIRGLILVGMVMVCISQFTDLYYYFDDLNQYQRASGFWICYVFPLISLILQFSFVVSYGKRLRRNLRIALSSFTLVPLLASLCQFATRGISLSNLTLALVVIGIFIFSVIDISNEAEKAKNIEISFLRKEQKDVQILLEQVSEALATAIDVKDPYTHGHSTRVAEYSKKIAEMSGKSESECDEIFFAALLHDVGKIYVPTDIINKAGKLTEEEFTAIKMHPVYGNQILSRISKSPYLSIGAHYHHERYDGKGYPDGLIGEDIPEIARIIAVADAYDAMTSKRSYRDPIPQEKVREEFVKGIGTQFDPQFAKMMIHLIDLDSEYEMKEREETTELASKREFVCENYRDNESEGIQICNSITRLRFHSITDRDHLFNECIPSIVVFDSLDGRIQDTEKKRKDTQYLEYATIRFDGHIEASNIRKVEKNVINSFKDKKEGKAALDKKGIDYELEAVKVKDHLLFRIKSLYETIEIVMALPDSIRFAYFSLTGEHCVISKVSMDKEEDKVADNYIPRIAEEISYIKGEPEGIIPNIEIDGWCYDATRGFEIKDGMQLSFHTKSLPTARLIWHCPYIELFYSDDMLVRGENYNQFALARLDGEAWDTHEGVVSTMHVNKGDDFEGWDAWKEKNKKGFDCVVTFKRNKNKITIITDNLGISVRNVVEVIEDAKDVYAALTGDQLAITNINIKK